MINAKSCELFEIPFFQFAQMKKYCPEEIPRIKANYKTAWEKWKALHLSIARQLGIPFAKPHIEKWCNGWQVRAHFFAYYKYEFHQNSAAILSVILNRRRLQVCLDWHCYRAERSQISLAQYHQWLTKLDRDAYQTFDVWQGTESEYANFKPLKDIETFSLEDDHNFWCIGRNIEKAELDQLDIEEFIYQTIRQLLPLYEACHQ